MNFNSLLIDSELISLKLQSNLVKAVSSETGSG